MRAIAVIMVVAYHAGLPLPGGFVGVDVFFVISGFVITAMLLREWEKRGRINFGVFYLRRFKRLTPALALTVASTLGVSALLLSPLGTQQKAAQTGLGALLLSANIVIARTTGGYFDAPAETNPLLNTWSLSVEEQFYLAFPLLLAASWALARRLKVPLVPVIVVTLVGVVSFGLAVLGSMGVSIPIWWAGVILDVLLGFYSPVTRAWEFAVGALLALILPRISSLSGGVTLSMGLLGSVLLAGSLWLISAQTPFPGPWTVLPVAGTALLLVAGSANENPVTRGLSHPVMATIGDWSYSIYLWHWPFIVFARLLSDGNAVAVGAAALLSLVPAYASYRWVEEPIRSMNVASAERLVQLVGATLVPPLAVAGGLVVAAGQGFWSQPVRAYQAATISLHAGAQAGCHSYAPLSDAQLNSCSWNGQAPGSPLYLVGDSHADHLSEALIGAGESLSRPVVISTTPHCPLTGGFLDRIQASDDLNADCRSDMAATLAYLRTADPGVVVLSSSDRYWSGSTVAFGRDETSATTDTERKLVAITDSLTDSVALLKDAGHQVLLVQTVPYRPDEFGWDPTACSLLDLLASPVGCGSEMPLSIALDEQSAPRAVLTEVASRTGAKVVDPGPSMCPGGLCAVASDGVVRLRDSVHISVAQSEALAPLFAEALKSRP